MIAVELLRGSDATGPQILLHLDGVAHGLPHAVHAPLVLEHGVERARGGQVAALQGRPHEVEPRLVAPARLVEECLLRRIVRDQRLQPREPIERVGAVDGLQESAVAGNEVTPQARLLIDDLPEGVVGRADHAVGVIDPPRVL